MSGYSNIKPEIKSIRFSGTNFVLSLVDGRKISVPLNKLPEIKKLSASQRKKYHIIAGVGFDFDDCDEVFHISEFLGDDNSLISTEKQIQYYPNASALSTVAEPKAKYKRKK